MNHHKPKKENQELKQVIEANRDEKRETKRQMVSLRQKNEEITSKLEDLGKKMHNEIAAKERMIKLQNECNETIRSLQKQSKQMSDEKRNEKSENVSLRRENQEITSKLKEFAMRDLKQQQHIKKLQNETQRMRAELDKIAMKEIKTLDVTQEIVIDEETMQKQKEFDEQMQMDEKRLNEWKCDSILIQNECKSEQKENAFQTDNNQMTTHLLNRFMECKTLCDKQQIRMENVIMYCSKLNKIKKILKKESVRCNQLVEERKKEHQELNAKYQILHKKRMKIQTQWINALQQMNKTIDDENTTNDAKCCAESQYNTSKLEAEQWNMLRTKCVQLIKNYRLFDAQNEQNIQKMSRMFDVSWNNA
eukprot:426689_1